MNNLPREQLKYIITQYGRSLSDDPQRCEALLRDLCGQYRKEINVIVSALKEQVPTDLLNSQSSVPSDLLLARLSKRLEDRLGLSQEAARWAVESWALALGLISERELQNEVDGQTAFEQNLKWQEAESKAQAEQARVKQQLESERLAAKIAARAKQDRKNKNRTLKQQFKHRTQREAEIKAQTEKVVNPVKQQFESKRLAEQDYIEQQQLESQTWNQKSLNSQTTKPNNTDLEVQRTTQLRKADRKIKVAWISGYILSGIYLIFLLYTIRYGIKSDATYPFILFSLQVGLSYGVQEKSRVCAGLMLLINSCLFLTGSNRMTLMLQLIVMVITVIFYQGFQGTFEYHNQRNFTTRN